MSKVNRLVVDLDQPYDRYDVAQITQAIEMIRGVFAVHPSDPPQQDELRSMAAERPWGVLGIVPHGTAVLSIRREQDVARLHVAVDDPRGPGAIEQVDDKRQEPVEAP